MSNVEPQNVEGWNRYALSFFIVVENVNRL